MRNVLAGHTNCYHGYPRVAALDGLVAAGFRFVELATGRGPHAIIPLEPTAADLATLRGELDARGLGISSISGHSDLTTDAGLEEGQRAVDVCAELDVTIMNTSVGGTYGEAEDKAAFMGRIGPLADYAAARGIILALEIHGDLMATGPQAVALVREIARPNVRINYDTANCTYYGGVKAEDDIAAVTPYLAHVHIKDAGGGLREWNFPPVGQGRVDFPRVLRILEDGGYTGPLSVEIEFYGYPYPPLDEVNAAVRASYEYLENLTTKKRRLEEK
jgi:sugar phosphate isomerase/epimerase